MKLLQEKFLYPITTLLVVLTNYALDRATKLLAVVFLKGKKPIPVIGNLFVLEYAENNGAFLSMGAGWNIYIKYFIFVIAPIGICLYVLYYAMFKEKLLRKIVLMGTIVGGGIGNLIDRLFNEFQVIDFMIFRAGVLQTGILNVADLSVTFGVIILIITEMTAREPVVKED
jgi:signal peptidase II